MGRSMTTRRSGGAGATTNGGGPPAELGVFFMEGNHHWNGRANQLLVAGLSPEVTATRRLSPWAHGGTSAASNVALATGPSQRLLAPGIVVPVKIP